jgi:hypothetical protein
LQVGSLVAPKGTPAPELDVRRVAVQGSWVVYEREPVPPKASLVGSWTVVRSGDAALNLPALRAVASPRFDPMTAAVLEGDPGFSRSSSTGPSGSSLGAVHWSHLGPQAERFEVRSAAPALLVVRNIYDRNWRATMDGHPVPLLRADYLLQGVAVPAGRHSIELHYDDPWIGWGMLGSALGLALLTGAALLVRRRWV